MSHILLITKIIHSEFNIVGTADEFSSVKLEIDDPSTMNTWEICD